MTDGMPLGSFCMAINDAQGRADGYLLEIGKEARRSVGLGLVGRIHLLPCRDLLRSPGPGPEHRYQSGRAIGSRPYGKVIPDVVPGKAGRG